MESKGNKRISFPLADPVCRELDLKEENQDCVEEKEIKYGGPVGALDRNLRLLKKAHHEMYSGKQRSENNIKKLETWIIATKQLEDFVDKELINELFRFMSGIINGEVWKIDSLNEVIRKAKKINGGI